MSVIVLGAGLAGLSVAHHLDSDCEVFEKEPWIGGHSRTKRKDGFCFDEGAHVFFGSDDVSREFVWEPLRGEMVEHEAEIWNHYDGRRFGRYPVQVNASALDPELATRCVLDFVAAEREPAREVRSYEEWARASFGRMFADTFMLRYARKVWTVEPSELTTQWLGSNVGGRISRPSLEEVVRGAVDSRPQVLNYLTRFAYPRTGFGRIAENLGARLRVRTDCGVRRVHAASRTISFDDGSERRYETAVSTLPLPTLVTLTADTPPQVREAADHLMWTSLRCVNLGVARSDIGPGHWVYFYDHAIPFFRVSFPSKFAPGMAPDGFSSISCEIAYSRRKLLDETRLKERVLASLRDTGIVDPQDQIVFMDEVDVPFAYVVFDFQRSGALATIHGWMEQNGLIPCGRFAEWGYHWSFEAIESGRRAARRVRSSVAQGS